jgi:hypothetical protein
MKNTYVQYRDKNQFSAWDKKIFLVLVMKGKECVGLCGRKKNEELGLVQKNRPSLKRVGRC